MEHRLTMFLTLPQVAARLTVSPTTVRRLIGAGLLPIIRVSPRRVAVPEKAVADYRGMGWQSGNRGGGLSLSFSKAESAYFDACRPASRKRKRANSRRSSGGSYSTASSSAAGTR